MDVPLSVSPNMKLDHEDHMCLTNINARAVTIEKMDVNENTSSSDDDTLNPESVKFDPLKVLYEKNHPLMSVPSRIYDNINMFENEFKGISARQLKQETNEPKEAIIPKPESASLTQKKKVNTELRILQGKNVLSAMTRILGPLGMLHECMENKTRVKIYTRAAKGIRGHVEAFVAAFDKHWNLALEDCLETWTRKIKRKAPASASALSIDNLRIEEPDHPILKIVVKKNDGKIETLERHVPQMLVRGEQIVYIVKL